MDRNESIWARLDLHQRRVAPTGLQPAALTTRPRAPWHGAASTLWQPGRTGVEGLEPPANGFEGRCSTVELHPPVPYTHSRPRV